MASSQLTMLSVWSKLVPSIANPKLEIGTHLSWNLAGGTAL